MPLAAKASRLSRWVKLVTSFITQLFLNRNFNQVKAAEAAQKFAELQLDPARTARLIKEHSRFEKLADFCIAELDAFQGHYENVESIYTVDDAVKKGLIPLPPQVTHVQVKAMIREAGDDATELYSVPIIPTNFRQGPHLRFIREGRGMTKKTLIFL